MIIQYNKYMADVLNNFKNLSDRFMVYEDTNRITVRNALKNGRISALVEFDDLVWDNTCLINNISDFVSAYNIVGGNMELKSDHVYLSNDSTAIKYQYAIIPSSVEEINKFVLDVNRLPKWDVNNLIYKARLTTKDFKLINDANKFLRYTNFYVSIDKDTGNICGIDVKNDKIIRTTNTFSHKPTEVIVNGLKDNIILELEDLNFLNGDYDIEIYNIPLGGVDYIVIKATSLTAPEGCKLMYTISFPEETIKAIR